jgi:CTP:molybdopterin cytidylyltransferase MocA
MTDSDDATRARPTHEGPPGGRPCAFPFAAIILGAGAGTRFGEPNASVEVGPGERFVDRVARTAAESGAEPIVAVLSPGVEPPAGVRVVRNPDPRSEQIASLRLGLALLTNTAVVGTLVWPVDYPFVTLTSVLAVVDAARRSAAPIVLPACGGRRGHPVWFGRDLWRELVTAATGGARSVVRAHATDVVVVDVPDPGVARDVDTPADLAAESVASQEDRRARG